MRRRRSSAVVRASVPVSQQYVPALFVAVGESDVLILLYPGVWVEEPFWLREAWTDVVPWSSVSRSLRSVALGWGCGWKELLVAQGWSTVAHATGHFVADR